MRGTGPIQLLEHLEPEPDPPIVPNWNYAEAHPGLNDGFCCGRVGYLSHRTGTSRSLLCPACILGVPGCAFVCDKRLEIYWGPTAQGIESSSPPEQVMSSGRSGSPRQYLTSMPAGH